MLFGPKGPLCQSCGMPMSKDPLGGGSERDGTKNPELCSHCYANGAFVQPSITADEMKALVKSKLQEMRMPGFIASYFAKDVPKRRRWQ